MELSLLVYELYEVVNQLSMKVKLLLRLIPRLTLMLLRTSEITRRVLCV